jgi:hypothetical protein
MQVENDYDKEVYNGDLGVVSRIDMENGELTVDFDGRELIYVFGCQRRNTCGVTRGDCQPASQEQRSPTGAYRAGADHRDTANAVSCHSSSLRAPIGIPKQ